MKHYLSLYRKYRPEVFPELIGQDHIVRILKHQIAADTLSHAYLLCGTRGTGKTTTARILAKAVNCTGDAGRPCGVCENCRAISAGRFMDVIEIDAASNNGVDNIRELRESVNYPPSTGRKKVYIIDEVHMLSQGGYNALLKTLEEPPEHVMFILATTNPEKMPQTVMSRCMRLDFKRVTAKELAGKMREICMETGVESTDEALSLLAANADGSVRDALSLLEQCLSGGDDVVDRETVLEYLGAVSQDFYLKLTDDIIGKRVSDAFFLLDAALRDGKDVKQIMKDWMEYYRSLLMVKFVKKPEDMLNMSADNIEKLREQSKDIGVSTLNRSIMILAKAINDAAYSTQARILMEVAIVAIAEETDYSDVAPDRHAARRSAPESDREAKAVTNDVQESKPRTRDSATGQAASSPQESKPRTRDSAAGQATSSPQEPKPRTRDSAAEQAASSPPKARMRYKQEELDDIWDAASDKIAAEQASMRVMKNFRLVAMNDTEFKIAAPGVNETFEKRLKDKTERICEVMEEQTGRKMRMVIKSSDPSAEEESAEEDIQSIAEKASGEIGVPVAIKESSEI